MANTGRPLTVLSAFREKIVSDIAIFVMDRDVKHQLTNFRENTIKLMVWSRASVAQTARAVEAAVQ